ncbi:hypothetical protein [Streptomyces sedi]|uniref:Uncharacterized protein n=1 Tax=Streptomyces sedi TaxID=555059 RepID=A0A5C4VEQ3_9ACTN|nr:hypothetical protein [Streptomyces sedi]TNM34407.1 hypothetical protein FH715_01625 [Streptomyces sedi]
MNEVIALVEALGQRNPLSSEDVAATLENRGWQPLPRRVTAPFPRAWHFGDRALSIQGDAPNTRVEISLRVWEYDEQAAADSEDFAYLDGLWDQAETEARRLVDNLTADGSQFPGAPVTLEEDDADEFLWHAAWSLSGRRLIVGSKQDDTDLPVRVVAVIT